MSAQEFTGISKVSCVVSRPKTVDSLNGTSFLEKANFCTFLQCKQLGEKSTYEEDHRENKPSRLADKCFEITVWSHPCSNERTQTTARKIAEAEDVSNSLNSLLEVGYRFT